MRGQWQCGLLVVVAAVLVVVVVVSLSPSRAAFQPGDGGTGGPRFSILETDGHNLIVTDNKSNICYFYTADKDTDVGADLKLRGSIDLNQVGKAVVRPKKAAGQ
jgi:hypothetical protein